jgi:fructose-1-phosphate kinase PfkB-like protein
VRSVEDAKTAALKLVDKGCGVAIITLADKGAVFVTKEMTEALHVKSVSVKVVDTTVSDNKLYCPFTCLYFNDFIPSKLVLIAILNY